MDKAARVELLHQGTTDEFEYWADRGHRVFLCRAAGQDEWHAIVDGDVVIDADQPEGKDGLAWPAKPLCAKTPGALVPLLALQEGVHIILDEAEAWSAGPESRLQERDAQYAK